MQKRNVKLLTDTERQYLNDKYEFEYDDKTNEVVVISKNYKKVARHNADIWFKIVTHVRCVTIVQETIAIWKSSVYKKSNFTLFDVQNAVNSLYVSYQDVNEQSVLAFLKKHYKNK